MRPSSTMRLSLGTKIASNRIVAAEKRVAKIASPSRAVADKSSASSEPTPAAGAGRTKASAAPPRDGAPAAGPARSSACLPLARQMGEPTGVRRRAGSRVLVVPVTVRLQQSAGDKVMGGRDAVFPTRRLGRPTCGRVGKPQQQCADLRAGELPVSQRGGDRVDAPAHVCDVERETIELGEFAIEIAFVAPCQRALGVALQQRNASDPQATCVALDASGASWK